MSYYGAGDYYGAGGLGSFLSGAVKGLAGAAAGFLTGGPVGAVTGALGATGVLGGKTSTAGPSLSTPLFAPGANQPGLDVGRFGINPLAVLPGGQPFITTEQQMAPRGYHLNKSGYFLKSGTYVPPRSRYVRNRTRNFANGRALRKSISRVKGFERLVKGSRKSLRSMARI